MSPSQQNKKGQVVPLHSKSSDGMPEFKKFVRIRSPEGARFVEFDFAIGDPGLFVELIMPQSVFDDFCRNNHVLFMTDAQMAEVDADMEKWRYGYNTLMSRNHDHQ